MLLCSAAGWAGCTAGLHRRAFLRRRPPPCPTRCWMQIGLFFMSGIHTLVHKLRRASESSRRRLQSNLHIWQMAAPNSAQPLPQQAVSRRWCVWCAAAAMTRPSEMRLQPCKLWHLIALSAVRPLPQRAALKRWCTCCALEEMM